MKMVKTRLVAAAGCVAAAMVSAASASLPVFGGATFSTDTNSGYFNALIGAAPFASINNAGAAIGEATFHTPAVSDGGLRPLEWTPAGWNSLSTGPDPASGVRNSHANGINDAGVTVGETDVFAANGSSLGQRALRWAPGGITQFNDLSLSPTGNGVTRALGINTAGVVVGSSYKYSGATNLGARPVRWAANLLAVTELTSLPATPSGFASGEAVDVNESGDATGFSTLYSGTGVTLGSRAVRWNSAGAITQLGTLGTSSNGSTTVNGIGINNSGMILAEGYKYDASHVYLGNRAIRYAFNSTTAVELGSLGTAANGSTNVQANSIDASGMVVGSSEDYFGTVAIGSRATYWTAGSTVANELPNMGLDNNFSTYAKANSSNAFGVVTGISDKYTGGVFQGRYAVIWTTAGTDAVIDLNTLLAPGSGWTLSEAVGISDTGFVSGTGYYTPNGANSYIRHFTMLVPQAGTYGLGDANFDTVVNFADLLLLAQKYGQANPTLSVNVADLNLDGVTNFTDLLALAQHYGQSVAGSFESDWALAQALVPEPVAAGLLFPFAMMLRRRRPSRTGRNAASAASEMAKSLFRE